MADFNVKMVNAEVAPGAAGIKLDMQARNKEPLSITFAGDEAEALLAAVADSLGRASLQTAQDQMLKKTMQLERWEVTSLPNNKGLLLTFGLRGELEVSVQLPRAAIGMYEEALSAGSGKWAIVPPG